MSNLDPQVIRPRSLVVCRNQAGVVLHAERRPVSIAVPKSSVQLGVVRVRAIGATAHLCAAQEDSLGAACIAVSVGNGDVSLRCQYFHHVQALAQASSRLVHDCLVHGKTVGEGIYLREGSGKEEEPLDVGPPRLPSHGAARSQQLPE